ncbi:MAG: hypothetical protein VX822_04575, partial [Candidatus Neomarinimicrobiota bacterium]|nr:hypothetical protein [Candidatus Neomarinimicrobiota bacterium]
MTPGDTTVTTGLDSLKMHLLTDLGKHYVRPRTHFSGTLDQVPDVVQFSMKDTISMKGFMVIQLQSDGLTTKATDELVITYPNGGETLKTEKIQVTWRSLGTSLPSQKIIVSTSTGDDPDISLDTDWKDISGGPIANVDYFPWTPEVADKMWLRVCNETKDICDRSLSFFKVEASSVAIARERLDKKQRSRAKKSDRTNQ